MSWIACQRWLLPSTLPDRRREQLEAIQNDQDGTPLVADNGQRQRQFEEQTSGDEHRHRGQREHQVLPDDRCCPTCQTMGFRELFHILRQECYISGLEGDV